MRVTRERMWHTWLPHTPEVDVQAAFVVAERRIARLVRLHPITYLVSELEVLAGRAVELVREGTEEAVAVAEGRGWVEPEGTELLVQLLSVLRGVRRELLDDPATYINKLIERMLKNGIKDEGESQLTEALFCLVRVRAGGEGWVRGTSGRRR